MTYENEDPMPCENGGAPDGIVVDSSGCIVKSPCHTTVSPTDAEKPVGEYAQQTKVTVWVVARASAESKNKAMNNCPMWRNFMERTSFQDDEIQVVYSNELAYIWRSRAYHSKPFHQLESCISYIKDQCKKELI